MEHQIGNVISQYRQNRKMTQEDFALRLGVTPHIMENNNAAFEKDILNNIIAEPLVLEFGTELVPCIAEGMKTDLIYQKRKELAEATGMLLPLVHIRDNTALGANEYRILFYDCVRFQAAAAPDASQACYAQIIQQVYDQCRLHYDALLNKQLVKTLVDNIKARYPGCADGLVPERISYLALERHLQKIIQEKGTLRDLLHILEDLESALPQP